MVIKNYIKFESVYVRLWLRIGIGFEEIIFIYIRGENEGYDRFLESLYEAMIRIDAWKFESLLSNIISVIIYY